MTMPVLQDLWKKLSRDSIPFLGTIRRPVGLVLSLAAIAIPPVKAKAAVAGSLASPDERIRVSVLMPEPGTTGRPRWSVVFRGREVATNCALGLQTVADGELLSGARVLSEKRQSADQRVAVLFGKSSEARDHYNEVRYNLEGARKQRLDVVFRCYDDAVALRYELAAGTGPSPVTIAAEHTSFRMAGNPEAFVQYLENYRTSHEHNVERVPYTSIKRGGLLDLPLTFSWPERTYVGITEAALRRYAGMALRFRDEDGSPALVSDLTPRPDGNRVVGKLPLATPWRVMLMGDHPGALLESQTLYCLNEPSAISDTSWIKPDRLTFHWWNGNVYDGKPGLPILSFEMAKKHIDFCARNGLTIHSLTSTEGETSPWYHQSKSGVAPGPDTDVIRPREGFELERIRRYAASKQVRLWTWVHQDALRGRVEEAFAAFERMGWSGMMVDFFDHDDQASVEFAESILEAAARRHILIHLHGVWKPTGLERTFPNLMNHEGALNLEYLKWSDRCTPEHNVMMAFTRLIAGPMDYHLGGFRAVRRDQFKPIDVGPNVLGTRGHMLAMYVCFNNPAPMIADYPTAYEGQPGFDFLQRVPTWWDDTHVLRDDIGELLVVARRKGSTWYLGGMSAGPARQITLPLSYLGKGRYDAHIWKDGRAAADNPNSLVTDTVRVSAEGSLNVSIAVDGGFVAELVPLK